MFHDNEQYTLRREIDGGGFTHYFIGYSGEQGFQESQVTRNVFVAYIRFGKKERNLRRWDERHKERQELSEVEINTRALQKPHSIEMLLVDAEQKNLLWQAISKLPEIQRRRLLMYHIDRMTYGEIADTEGCTKRAVKFSVDIAGEKIRNYFASLGYTFRL